MTGDAQGEHDPHDDDQADGDGVREVDPVLVASLATGMSYFDTGLLMNRSERTVRRRAALPEVREAVAEYRRELAAQAAGRLAALLEEAVTALAAGLHGASSVRAADLILRHASRLTNEIESQSRMEALAAEIARLMRNDSTGGDASATGGVR